MRRYARLYCATLMALLLMAASAATAMPDAELNALRAKLISLWNPPAAVSKHPGLYVVTIRIRLARDHRLVGQPEVLSSGDGPLFEATRDSAVRAVLEAQPYDMLSLATYDQWKEIDINFDPREVYAPEPSETSTPEPPNTPPEQGHASAQNDRGEMYAEGRGVPRDDGEAVKLFRLAAEQGHAKARTNLGMMYETGRGVRQDYNEAMKWYRLAAEQGVALARTSLGWMYRNGLGVRKDYDEAIKWYRLAAAQGEAVAQQNLGWMYEGGLGVPRNDKEAIKWYRLAAAQGNADAQTGLGYMHANGRGVRKDYGEAVKWYRLAAEQGNAIAQSNLGEMYAYGYGVRKDYGEAAKWYRLAAAQGNAIAQNNLGTTYRDGHGVPQDAKEAVKWYRLAASQGAATAQVNLGGMYLDGQGVPQNYVLAYMWFAIAKKLGAADFKGGAISEPPLDALFATVILSMTNAQFDLAQKMTKRCVESNYQQCGKPKDGQFSVSETSVPMRIEGGTYVVPVLINDAITLDFIVDSGAADVSIPADVVSTLMRTKTLKETDFLGEQTYVLADGSKVPSQTFVIRSLKVGNTVLENVHGSVASVHGTLLLGQTFLSRFKSWSVDNTKHALLLSE
jgi:TPR repeat protein/predicted aspartyl protease